MAAVKGWTACEAKDYERGSQSDWRTACASTERAMRRVFKAVLHGQPFKQSRDSGDLLVLPPTTSWPSMRRRAGAKADGEAVLCQWGDQGFAARSYHRWPPVQGKRAMSLAPTMNPPRTSRIDAVHQGNTGVRLTALLLRLTVELR
jgi:hypothetical protein